MCELDESGAVNQTKTNNQISFKERIRLCAIENAKAFQENFINYEYCVISKAFGTEFRTIHAFDGNYLHLVGVSTSLSAEAFFRKCLNATLSENDFDFKKAGVAKGVIKGAVRDKIRVLPNMVSLLSSPQLLTQENYSKNQIACAFASSDGACVLGFSLSGHPKSLLNGNLLDKSKSKPVDVLLRKSPSAEYFSEVVFDRRENRSEYSSNEKLQNILSDELKTLLFPAEQPE